MTAQTDTFGDSMSMTYDKGGNVKTRTDAKGIVTTMAYDAQGVVRVKCARSNTQGFKLESSLGFSNRSDKLSITKNSDLAKPKKHASLKYTFFAVLFCGMFFHSVFA
jgi:YD repeat-containing protein